MTKKTDTTITFSTEHAYEVTGIWTKAGKMPALQEYFAQVFPIAVERYGLQPLLSLEPLSTYRGDFMPDVMFVNQWPSLERFNAFLDDPEVKKLMPQRDDATERLVVTHYRVNEDTSTPLGDGDVVEYNAMWIKSGQENEIAEYYGKVFPIAQQSGVTPLAGMTPLGNYRGNFMPTRAGLLHWGKKENFDTFIAKAAPYVSQRDRALTRLEVVHATVRLGGDK